MATIDAVPVTVWRALAQPGVSPDDLRLDDLSGRKLRSRIIRRAIGEEGELHKRHRDHGEDQQSENRKDPGTNDAHATLQPVG